MRSIRAPSSIPGMRHEKAARPTAWELKGRSLPGVLTRTTTSMTDDRSAQGARAAYVDVASLQPSVDAFADVHEGALGELERVVWIIIQEAGLVIGRGCIRIGRGDRVVSGESCPHDERDHEKFEPERSRAAEAKQFGVVGGAPAWLL